MFRFAVVEGLAASDPTRNVSDGLAPQPKHKSQPWFRPEVLPEFFADLNAPHEDAAIIRIALRLYMHTVLRSWELHLCEWEQIRGDEWHVPEGQMKTVRGESLAHIVPLSRQSLALPAPADLRRGLFL